MQRPSLLLMLVILLASILFVREPRLQRFDEDFLRWLLKNSPPSGAAVPLTVVDLGTGALLQPDEEQTATEQFLRGSSKTISPQMIATKWS